MTNLGTFPDVAVYLGPGIYRIGQDSCEGKTYMNYLIDKYSKPKMKLRTYSYKNYIEGEPIQSKIGQETKILFLDRYDLYAKPEDAPILEDFVERGGTVLLDCKVTDNMWVSYKYCMIDRRKEGIFII